MHRYSEIKEFPHALNNSQMWNWQTRMFITEAKMNLSVEAQGGEPSKYTQEEIDSLEKTLKEHEVWLNEMVEKQKGVKYYQDPAVESRELREKAKVLESALQKLVRKKVPRKKTTTTTTTNGGSSSSSTKTQSESTKHDEL